MRLSSLIINWENSQNSVPWCVHVYLLYKATIERTFQNFVLPGFAASRFARRLGQSLKSSLYSGFIYYTY